MIKFIAPNIGSFYLKFCPKHLIIVNFAEHLNQ